MEKTVPQDDDAERHTLGALLLERDNVVSVSGFLEPEHFMAGTHGAIYAAILACFARREPPDTSTVASELRRAGRLEQSGGPAYLARLMRECPTAVHVEYYARNVWRAAVCRRLIQVGGRIAGLGYEAEAEPEALLAQAGTLLAQLRAGDAGRWLALPAVIGSVLDDIAATQAGGVRAIPSGLPLLDRELAGGWRAGELVILAALTSNGKSAMALQVGLHAAKQGHAVAIVSLEMDAASLGRRALAMESGVDSLLIRSGELGEGDLDRLSDSAASLGALGRLVIRDMPLVDVDALRAEVARLKADGGCDLLIVDYLQLLGGERRRSGTREQEITDISRKLLLLAAELRIPVLALSQFSRKAIGAEEPEIEHLRESGAIGQNASVVLLLHRPEPKEHPERVDLIIAKSREGRRDRKIPLEWYGPALTFREVEGPRLRRLA